MLTITLCFCSLEAEFSSDHRVLQQVLLEIKCKHLFIF